MEPLGGKKVYCLKLESGKYYVGTTENFVKRLAEHTSGNGSKWTQKYPVVDVLEVRPCTTDLDEEFMTKLYMYRYGIDNVRGARYVQVIMPSEMSEFLQRDLWSAQGRCSTCGDIAHFVTDCTSSKPYKKLVSPQESTTDNKPHKVRRKKSTPSELSVLCINCNSFKDNDKDCNCTQDLTKPSDAH